MYFFIFFCCVINDSLFLSYNILFTFKEINFTHTKKQSNMCGHNQHNLCMFMGYRLILKKIGGIIGKKNHKIRQRCRNGLKMCNIIDFMLQCIN